MADLAIARIATRQHGVVTFGQILAASMGKNTVTRRVRRGQLHRVHRGVYAVGHPGLSAQGRWMAAVLACGRGAVLSHGSAAVLWGLLREVDGPVDVSVPSQAGRRKRAGIELHRRPGLGPDDLTRRQGIPVTSPARTIADLRGAVPPYLVRRARRQAVFLGLRLTQELKRDRTRSDLEGDFLRLCRRHRLDPPEVNVRIGPWTVDFLWRERRLVVETDSYIYHRGRQAFEDDRERDLALRGLGHDVLRFADRHLTSEPDRVAGLLREALAARDRGGTG